MAKPLTINITKELIGKEDLAFGKGHITQHRANGIQQLHKLNIGKTIGLIHDALANNILDTIDTDIVQFTGFYEENDGGEGTYIRLKDKHELNDIGVVITTDTVSFMRLGIDEGVKLEWFGAKGDGITNDLQAFIYACAYPKIHLSNGKHYFIQLHSTMTIHLQNVFELLGNNATITLQVLYDDVGIIFNPLEQLLYFIISNVTIHTIGAKQPYELYNQNSISFIDAVDTVIYSPKESIPDLPEFVYTLKNQTITGTWTLNSAPTADIEGTLPEHPVTKSQFDKFTQLTEDSDYVLTNSTATITGSKIYTNQLATVSSTSPTAAVTKETALNYFVNKLKQDPIVTTPQLVNTPPTMAANILPGKSYTDYDMSIYKSYSYLNTPTVNNKAKYGDLLWCAKDCETIMYYHILKFGTYGIRVYLTLELLNGDREFGWFYFNYDGSGGYGCSRAYTHHYYDINYRTVTVSVDIYNALNPSAQHSNINIGAAVDIGPNAGIDVSALNGTTIYANRLYVVTPSLQIVGILNLRETITSPIPTNDPSSYGILLRPTELIGNDEALRVITNYAIPSSADLRWNTRRLVKSPHARLKRSVVAKIVQPR